MLIRRRFRQNITFQVNTRPWNDITGLFPQSLEILSLGIDLEQCWRAPNYLSDIFHAFDGAIQQGHELPELRVLEIRQSVLAFNPVCDCQIMPLC
jgi:hypothetical protein